MVDGGNILRRVDVFRSSITRPYYPNMPHGSDMARRITKEGVEMARQRQKALGYPRYDIALFSPALRCIFTAAEIGEITEVPVFLQLDELGYKGEDTPEGKAFARMYSQLGEANLHAYVEQDSSNMIGNHAKTAWAKVMRDIVECGSRRTLVVGHNILINAMGFVACDQSDEHPNKATPFETVVFKRCEGYSLFLTDSTVTKVDMHI